MSQETMDWLHDNVKVGFTDSRGAAWWASRGVDSTDSFGRKNHYPGAIPLDDVLNDLPAFRTEAISVPVTAVYDNPYFGSNLDYVEAVDTESETVTLTDASRQVVLRPDTKAIFGVFKDGYVIHQYREVFTEWASKILDTSISDLGIANVVTLRNGAVASMQFEVPENVTTKEGVVIRPSLFTVTSMDGSLASMLKRVFTNVVCDNTQRVALREKGAEAKVKHTLHSLDKLDAMRAKLEIEFMADAFSEEIDRLVRTPVTGLQFKQFLTELRKDKDGNDPLAANSEDGRARTVAENKQDRLMNLWLNDERVSPWMGTAYGVLQLTNTYMQHSAPTNKGTIRYERNVFDAASGKIEKSDKLTLDLLDKILVNA